MSGKRLQTLQERGRIGLPRLVGSRGYNQTCTCDSAVRSDLRPPRFTGSSMRKSKLIRMRVPPERRTPPRQPRMLSASTRLPSPFLYSLALLSVLLVSLLLDYQTFLAGGIISLLPQTYVTLFFNAILTWCNLEACNRTDNLSLSPVEKKHVFSFDKRYVPEYCRMTAPSHLRVYSRPIYFIRQSESVSLYEGCCDIYHFCIILHACICILSAVTSEVILKA